jgi:hypothetical protein
VKAADVKVSMKRKSPLLVWMVSTLRFIREISRAVRLLSKLESLSGADSVSDATGRQVVLFNLVRTYVPIQLVIEATLALKLKTRGYDVHILYDDGVL